MLQYFIKRAFMALLVALTVSIVAFVLLNVAVDPAQAIAGEDADLLLVEQVRAQYGFDRPIMVRYLDWLSRLLRGDLGESYYWNKPVGELILSHAPVTLRLASMAVCVTIMISLPLGIIAALKQNSLIDRFALSVAVSCQALPVFWFGLILIIIFSVTWQIFPVSGDTTIIHFILPAFVLGARSVPAVMRLTRNGLLDVMASDYIRTARSKGFGGLRLLFRHAGRNAILPVVSVLAVQLGEKLAGSVITESIFALNGLGRLALESILGGDIPTVQILVFVFALTFVIMTLAADLINAWLDPRVRLG